MHGKYIQSIPSPNFFGENLYDRPKFNHPLALKIDGGTPESQLYKIKKLVDKRIRKCNNTNVAQYFSEIIKKRFSSIQKHFRFNCLDLMGKYETSVSLWHR